MITDVIIISSLALTDIMCVHDSINIADRCSLSYQEDHEFQLKKTTVKLHHNIQHFTSCTLLP